MIKKGQVYQSFTGAMRLVIGVIEEEGFEVVVVLRNLRTSFLSVMREADLLGTHVLAKEEV